MAARSATDPDLWWHLRTGQLIVQNHAVFHADPYSFTRFGQPWVDHEWLSQVLMFGLYRLAGWGGLIAGFAAVVATAFMVVLLRCSGPNLYRWRDHTIGRFRFGSQLGRSSPDAYFALGERASVDPGAFL